MTVKKDWDQRFYKKICMLLCVEILDKMILSVPTQSSPEKCFMSMWHIWQVGRLVFVMAIAAVLSSKSCVVLSWGIPRSCNMKQRYNENLTASAVETKSVSVEDCEIVG